MKQLSIFISIAFCLMACKQAQNSGKHIDKFYTEKGGFDWSRFPLIKPYEMVTVIPSQGWLVRSADTSGIPDTVPGVEYINVLDSNIFIYGKNTILVGQSVSEGWFVLIPKKRELHGFKTKSEYLAYLLTIGIKEPKMYDVTEVFNYFDTNDQLDWKTLSRSF